MCLFFPFFRFVLSTSVLITFFLIIFKFAKLQIYFHPWLIEADVWYFCKRLNLKL
jgi:hypothetical protein